MINGDPYGPEVTEVNHGGGGCLPRLIFGILFILAMATGVAWWNGELDSYIASFQQVFNRTEQPTATPPSEAASFATAQPTGAPTVEPTPAPTAEPPTPAIQIEVVENIEKWWLDVMDGPAYLELARNSGTEVRAEKEEHDLGFAQSFKTHVSLFIDGNPGWDQPLDIEWTRELKENGLMVVTYKLNTEVGCRWVPVFAVTKNKDGHWILRKAYLETMKSVAIACPPPAQ